MDEPDLRASLERITRQEQDTAKHPGLVSALSGHSIKHVTRSDPRAPAFPEYNCFAFAFNLADSRKFRLIASRFTTIHAGETFAEFLIENGVLSEIAPDAAAGVVIYFDGVTLTHAGRFTGNRVLSKWGCGELWDHAVCEVPAQYGAVVKFYAELAPDVAEAAFIKFAERRGVVEPERLLGWHAG